MNAHEVKYTTCGPRCACGAEWADKGYTSVAVAQHLADHRAPGSGVHPETLAGKTSQ